MDIIEEVITGIISAAAKHLGITCVIVAGIGIIGFFGYTKLINHPDQSKAQPGIHQQSN